MLDTICQCPKIHGIRIIYNVTLLIKTFYLRKKRARAHFSFANRVNASTKKFLGCQFEPFDH